MSALHAYVLDPLERAASTFVQQFVVLLLATGSAGLVGFQSWGRAAGVAGFAALFSILTSVLTFWVPKQSAAVDLALRVLKTGIQSFLGSLAAAGVSSLLAVDWKAALATAIPVMMVALLKGLGSLSLPWTDGASLLPVQPYAYATPAPELTATDGTTLDTLRAGDPALNDAGNAANVDQPGTTTTP